MNVFFKVEMYKPNGFDFFAAVYFREETDALNFIIEQKRSGRITEVKFQEAHKSAEVSFTEYNYHKAMKRILNI